MTMTMTMTMKCTMLLGLLLATTANAQGPKDAADDTWISVDGTILSVSADSFELDYGEGMITVEMDDGDRDADGYKLDVGEKVRVSGMVDDDLFETRTIEASSVYVEEEGTHFFASAVDEEDTFVTYTTPVVVSDTVIQGTVTSVDADDEEFVLSTGTRLIN